MWLSSPYMVRTVFFMVFGPFSVSWVFSSCFSRQIAVFEAFRRQKRPPAKLQGRFSGRKNLPAKLQGPSGGAESLLQNCRAFPAAQEVSCKIARPFRRRRKSPAKLQGVSCGAGNPPAKLQRPSFDAGVAMLHRFTRFRAAPVPVRRSACRPATRPSCSATRARRATPPPPPFRRSP